jgi:DNA-binding NtrC family response regulator
MLSPATEQVLMSHPWPGNARELKHVIERACVLAQGPVISPDLLFDGASSTSAKPPDVPLEDWLADKERDYILRALAAQGWRIQDTAKLLGISRKNLWEKMKKLEISKTGELSNPEK